MSPTQRAGILGPGWLLAQARRDAGLTQAELARRLGISQPAVAQLERFDSNPRIETLERALRAVGAELVIDARWPEQSTNESTRAAPRAGSRTGVGSRGPKQSPRRARRRGS
jgi:transcriptional regulator with XRE-family HTH domain